MRKDLYYPFELPSLPYAKNALEPHISERTFSFHYDKHHKAYVDNLNKLLENSPNQSKSLEELIMLSYGKNELQGIFNNAAQVWNHTFFWHCMKQSGGGMPSGELASAIDRDFGSLDAFKEQFKQAAITQFGSGWAWLVKNGEKLEIMKTSNADLPMAHGKKALLTVDVWEHSYYIDYQNKRLDYVQIFMDHLIDWDFVASNFKS